MVTNKSLKDQIQIMDKTFEKNNLSILDIGIGSLDLDNGWFTLLIELETLNGNCLDNSVDIKVNIYDDDGLILNDELYLDESFAGYDTISIYIQEEAIAFKSKKIKLFAKTINF